jgi:hypothetical protein
MMPKNAILTIVTICVLLAGYAVILTQFLESGLESNQVLRFEQNPGKAYTFFKV